MKNKKALAPFILIPLIVVGSIIALILLYFIIKALVGVVITFLIWLIALGFVALAVFAIYFMIKWARSKK